MKVTLEKSKFSIQNRFKKVACSFWIKIMTPHIRKELYPERFFYLHPKTSMVYYSSGDVTFYKEKGYHVSAVFKIAYLPQDFNRQYRCFLKVRLPYKIIRRRVSRKYFFRSSRKVVGYQRTRENVSDWEKARADLLRAFRRSRSDVRTRAKRFPSFRTSATVLSSRSAH